MLAEDFSYYLKEIPGVFFLLGSKKNKQSQNLHSNSYFFPEELLVKGLKLFYELVFKIKT